MAKDVYYFPHESNAHNDPKITKLLLALKAEGYGIYWVIIEMLRNEENLTLSASDFDAIAYQSHSNSITVARVVNEFDLFTINKDGTFHSQSLIRRVEIFREKSKKYAENAHKRWNNNAMALQSQSNGNALNEMKGNERKGNEKKERKIFTPPTLEEVKLFKKETNSIVEPQGFIDFYASKGWKVGKVKMVDWKAAFRRAESWEQWAKPKPQTPRIENTLPKYDPDPKQQAEVSRLIQETLRGLK